MWQDKPNQTNRCDIPRKLSWNTEDLEPIIIRETTTIYVIKHIRRSHYHRTYTETTTLYNQKGDHTTFNVIYKDHNLIIKIRRPSSHSMWQDKLHQTNRCEIPKELSWNTEDLEPITILETTQIYIIKKSRHTPRGTKQRYQRKLRARLRTGQSILRIQINFGIGLNASP